MLTAQLRKYTTAYSTTPSGEKHALIYNDEVGENIFQDGETSTDPVQAGIIQNVLNAYEVLFTKDTFTDYNQRVEDAKVFVENAIEGGNYTEESVAAFDTFLTDASKYFEYYLDRENPEENKDYWRFTTLTGQDIKTLLIW